MLPGRPLASGCLWQLVSCVQEIIMNDCYYWASVQRWIRFQGLIVGLIFGWHWSPKFECEAGGKIGMSYESWNKFIHWMSFYKFFHGAKDSRRFKCKAEGIYFLDYWFNMFWARFLPEKGNLSRFVSVTFHFPQDRSKDPHRKNCYNGLSCNYKIGIVNCTCLSSLAACWKKYSTLMLIVVW